MQAASKIQASDDDCRQDELLSDTLSVLQAYQNNRLHTLSRALHQIARTRRTVLQWISAHCRVSGNEYAGVLAKEGGGGARKAQPDNSISYSEEEEHHHGTLNAKTLQGWLLSGKWQVALVGMSTGHNRLNDHMHQKLKLVPLSTCPCGQEEETTDHILQRCPLDQVARQDVWLVC